MLCLSRPGPKQAAAPIAAAKHVSVEITSALPLDNVSLLRSMLLLLMCLNLLLLLLLRPRRRHVVVGLGLALAGAVVVFAVTVVAITPLLFRHGFRQRLLLLLLRVVVRRGGVRGVRVVAAQIEVLLCGCSMHRRGLLLLLHLLLLNLLLLHGLSLGLLGVLVGGLCRGDSFTIALVGVSLSLSLSLSVSGVDLGMLHVLGFLLPQILSFLSPCHGLKASLGGRGKRRREAVVRGRVAILLAAWGRETELRPSRWSRGRRVAHVAGGRVGGAARRALGATGASRLVACGRWVCLGRSWLAHVMLMHNCFVALRFSLRLCCSCLGKGLCLCLAFAFANKLVLAPLLLHQCPVPSANTIIRPLVGARVR
ncbi:hypothetical protein BKA81DRAFT_50298 [Phyllosticta paracitricarpa]|uniref:Uncharacterized protein n=1 Tax=Phyllosticta paracitricarpa TaxID=2016321 RepID=A0ABR1NDN8_9PEZI